jgi:hypothetical protein
MPEMSLYLKIRLGFLRVNNCSPAEHRFWRWVEKDGPVLCDQGPCWVWWGPRNPKGYGYLNVDKKHAYAHRYSWGIHHGGVGNGAMVLHRCDNPSCVNPAHLFVGDAQVNSRDMVNKGRAPDGERQWMCKLTVAQVAEIRARYKRYSHQDGCGAMARDYNVSLTEVWRIVKSKKWRRPCCK